jgi:uncharacterized iron-regulated membrane protein
MSNLSQKPMTGWRRWLERPQQMWIRRALFQVHLWVGIGVGIYVLAVSISGSAVVFRRPLTRKYTRRTVVIAQTDRPRMTVKELTARAQQVYPGYEVYGVYESTRPDRADQIVLGRGTSRIERWFDPYSGEDLGDPENSIVHALEWLVDLHDNLLAGQTGRLVNGVGALLFLVLALTGIVIWWPGIKHWRRSLGVNWQTHFARLNWDLHSAIGFWCLLIVLIWGVSGVYLSFPGAFNNLFPDHFLAVITRLHFGRYNVFTEILWTVVGLAPAILFVTGALMWWNRVLRKKLRQWG